MPAPGTQGGAGPPRKPLPSLAPTQPVGQEVRTGPARFSGLCLRARGRKEQLRAAGLGSGSLLIGITGELLKLEAEAGPTQDHGLSAPRAGLGFQVFSAQVLRPRQEGRAGAEDLAEGGQPPTDELEGPRWLRPAAAHTPTP